MRQLHIAAIKPHDECGSTCESIHTHGVKGTCTNHYLINTPLDKQICMLSYLIVFRKDICRNSYKPCETLGNLFFSIFLSIFQRLVFETSFDLFIVYLRYMFLIPGLSNMDGMCSSGSECSFNQDTGFTLVYTIAHELGHK